MINSNLGSVWQHFATIHLLQATRDKQMTAVPKTLYSVAVAVFELPGVWGVEPPTVF